MFRLRGSTQEGGLARRIRVGVASLSLLGAVGAVATGAVVAGTVGSAAADTTSFTTTCTGVPVLNTASFGTVVTGTVTPNPPSNTAATLSNFNVDITIPSGLVTIIGSASGGGQINSGSIDFNVTAAGATPASQTATAVVPSTTIAQGATAPVTIIAPATLNGSFTAAASGALALSSGTSYSVQLTLSGTPVPAFPCTAPAEVISATTITPTPYITPSPNSAAFASATATATIGVNGGNWAPSSTVDLSLAGGPGANANTSTCTTDASGNLSAATCTIVVSKSDEQGSSTNSTPFAETIKASGPNTQNVTTLASTTIQITPFVSLNPFCVASATNLGLLNAPTSSTAPENPRTITRGGDGSYPVAATAVVGCDPKQQIDTFVFGTDLYVWDTTTAPNPDAAHVAMSPVILGLDTNHAANGGNLVPCLPPFPGNNPACLGANATSLAGPFGAVNNGQFTQSLGRLNQVTVQDDRGTLTGWTVTGQLESNFTNVASAGGPAIDNVIPADFLTWAPSVALATPGQIPPNNQNAIPGCPDETPVPASGGGLLNGAPCTGPSGLASTATAGQSDASKAAGGVNGTAAGTPGYPNPSATGNDSVPAEVFAGSQLPLNNLTGSADVLCSTNLGLAGGLAGGGGTFNCNAGLLLAVPPYVAQGDYRSVMDITVLGF